MKETILFNTARLGIFRGDFRYVETRNFASLQDFWVVDFS